jgi:hypothetical protein
MEAAMHRNESESGLDRETRRWVFDAVTWLAGIVLAAVLVAEAAAGTPAVATQGAIAGAQQRAVVGL